MWMIMKIIFILIFMVFNMTIYGSSYNMGLWSDAYELQLLKKAGEMTPNLAAYPSLQYPNRGYEKILEKYDDQKVLLFGYGSLMNRESASRSLKPEAVESMLPTVAFGVKRIFNYKASKTDQWGQGLNPLEKAMLNLIPTTTYKSIANGVVMKVDQEDFMRLVQREVGYDLMPILVADWNSVIAEDPCVEIKVAYTFIVPDETRNGIDYTQSKYYPVRGYLHASEDGASVFGTAFLKLFDYTSFLANGTTRVYQWDQKDFETLLKSKEP